MSTPLSSFARLGRSGLAARGRVAPWVLVLACAGALAACWILPVRMALGPGGSFYTCGYIADEYCYLSRLQPLLAGATATNPVNGICAPGVYSQFFLEDLVRVFLSVTGLNVVVFAWVWRVLFPCCLLASLLVLGRQALPWKHKPWAATLRWSAVVAAFSAVFLLYNTLMPFPPLQGWLNRIPTNVEFPLSVLLAWLYLRFLETPNARACVLLALAGAVSVYLRVYLVLPWAVATSFGALWLLWTRRCSIGVLARGAAAGAAVAAPYVIVGLLNQQSPVYRELITRYFELPAHYAVHPCWPTQVGLALVILLVSFRQRGPGRIFGVSTGLTLAVFPFACGLLTTISKELLLPSDRFACFHHVALVTAALCGVGALSARWGGLDGARAARRWSVGLLAFAAGAACEVAARNLDYDFTCYRPGQCEIIREDTRYVPAYEWVRKNTPADALFMVDDGYDWTGVPADAERLRRTLYFVFSKDDLFQIVARRKRLYTARLYGNALSNDELLQLAMLQAGTFGFPVDKSAYVQALKRYLPDYILWRRTALVPRGFGKVLQNMRETVYSDGSCEIWRMTYSRSNMPAPPPGPGPGP